MTTRCTVQGVPPDNLDRAWPEVAPLLADALARCPGYTLSVVKDGIQKGRYLLWVVMTDRLRAAVVLYPDAQSRAVEVWLMGGDGMEDWLDTLIEALGRYAGDLGYNALQAVVRPGLSKTLKGRGWKATHVVMRHTL